MCSQLTLYTELRDLPVLQSLDNPTEHDLLKEIRLLSFPVFIFPKMVIFWPSELSTGKAAFFLGYPWSREQGDLWIDCKPNPVEYQDCCQMLRLIAC